MVDYYCIISYEEKHLGIDLSKRVFAFNVNKIQLLGQMYGVGIVHLNFDFSFFEQVELNFC